MSEIPKDESNQYLLESSDGGVEDDATPADIANPDSWDEVPGGPDAEPVEDGE